MDIGRFEPDGLTVTLLAFGLLSLVVPMLRAAGLVAVGAGLAYWATMVAVRTFYERGS